jgi:hypothetical protein
VLTQLPLGPLPLLLLLLLLLEHRQQLCWNGCLHARVQQQQKQQGWC